MNWARQYLSNILILFLGGCATSIDLLKTKTVPQNESAAFNSEVQHMSPKLHWAFGN
jgi:hypothetical protein